MSGLGAAAVTGAALTGLTNMFDSSRTTGGSVNSSGSASENYAESQAQNYAAEANAWSAEQARIAHERQKELLQMSMDFNSKEAQKARDWQQSNIDIANEMANTVYSRSVKDMIDAGINPILAAGAGLGAAGAGSVTSGAGASIGTPSTYMGQTTAQYNSASHSQGQGSSWGNGSSWNSSESGILTGLTMLGESIGAAINAITSSNKFDIAVNLLGDVVGDKDKNGTPDIVDTGKQKAKDVYNTVKDTVKIMFDPNTIKRNALGVWDMFDHNNNK